ncbi:MAG: hypothetical protein WD181_05585 [Solirubrobacterales bacterium]
MGMKKKLFSVAAVVVVAGAIGAAPASAGPTGFQLPSTETLTALCTKVKQPSLQTACNQAVATVVTCSTAGSTKAIISCGKTAASGFALAKVKLPSSLKDLLAKLSGSGTGGFNLQGLLGRFDISKLLSGLKL